MPRQHYYSPITKGTVWLAQIVLTGLLLGSPTWIFIVPPEFRLLALLLLGALWSVALRTVYRMMKGIRL